MGGGGAARPQPPPFVATPLYLKCKLNHTDALHRWKLGHVKQKVRKRVIIDDIVACDIALYMIT